MRNIAQPLSRPGAGLSRMADQIWRFLVSLDLALQVRRERNLIAGLDERTLKDLGFNRAAACAEAGRAFWDLPANRAR